MTNSFYDPHNGVLQPEGYTVWVCEVGPDGVPMGTHHVSYHIGTQAESVELAKADTAMDWYETAEQSGENFENLHVLGVCVGNVYVLEWDEGA
jgi:hypothetical protein